MSFPTEQQREIWLSLREDAPPTGPGGRCGSGTATDPYDASSATLFDDLLASCPEGTVIHLGPGVFQTRGYNTGITGGVAWTPQSRQKIVGAGMFITTLKLVDAQSNPTVSQPTPDKTSYDAECWTIGAFTDYFVSALTVEHLTIDANMGGQPVPAGQTFPWVACGAIGVEGRHLRFHRVRAINCGSLSGGYNPAKPFVLFSSTSGGNFQEAVDNVVEDCLVEHQNFDNAYSPSTIGHAGGEDSAGALLLHRGCVVRNCLVDGDVVDRPVPIAQITFDTTTATVTTKLPHGRLPGEWVAVSGALENSSASLTFNGAFQITSVLSSTRFTYTMPKTPDYLPTGDMYIGKMSGQVIVVQSAVQNPADHTECTLITATPHYRTPFSSVLVSTVFTSNAAPNPWDNPYNGLFKPVAIDSNTKLRYRMTFVPGSSDTREKDPGQAGDCTYATINGTPIKALATEQGVGAIVEGNRIYGCAAPYYHDTWSSVSVFIRKNYLYEAEEGVMHQLNGSIPHTDGSSITQSLTDSFTAIFTSQGSHGLSVGDGVAIQNAVPSAYDGDFVVTGVPNPTIFTYRMQSDPHGDATHAYDTQQHQLPYIYGRIWAVGLLVCSRNVIELIPSIRPNYGSGESFGIYLGGRGATGLPVYAVALIRRNHARFVGGQSSPTRPGGGAALSGCDNLIFENNLIQIDGIWPIQYSYCRMVSLSNNQTPSGQLCLGYDQVSGIFSNEISTDVQFALLRR